MRLPQLLRLPVDPSQPRVVGALALEGLLVKLGDDGFRGEQLLLRLKAAQEVVVVQVELVVAVPLEPVRVHVRLRALHVLRPVSPAHLGLLRLLRDLVPGADGARVALRRPRQEPLPEELAAGARGVGGHAEPLVDAGHLQLRRLLLLFAVHLLHERMRRPVSKHAEAHVAFWPRFPVRLVAAAVMLEVLRYAVVVFMEVRGAARGHELVDPPKPAHAQGVAPGRRHEIRREALAALLVLPKVGRHLCCAFHEVLENHVEVISQHHVSIHVDPAVQREHGSAHKVALGQRVQPEEAVWQVWDKVLDGRGIHQVQLKLIRRHVPHPGPHIEPVARWEPIRKIPPDPHGNLAAHFFPAGRDDIQFSTSRRTSFCMTGLTILLRLQFGHLFLCSFNF
mmetsp:Transcript_44904/g.128247  ORF Transcript_44904/g.128247 Transcript_44904/m.128247 type:complete len:394 (+) Transcript_44904:180-1361(+)